MRTLVRNISIYAKHQHPGFVVIPQNGHELLTDNGTHSGKPVMSYVKALDGLGQESLFYGYNLDDQITPDAVTRWLTGFLDIGKKTGLSILVTDYCSTRLSVVDATRKNRERGYIPFAASSRNLDRIPTFFNSPVNANHANVTNLKQAKNFLYLVNPGRFESKDSFLQTIKKTGHDVLIIDLFFNETQSITVEDKILLETRPNGSRRLVIAYMSIGEAEEYRYYWRPAWKPGYPAWVGRENPNWPGNFKVRYWMEEWQKMLYGSDSAYLDKILKAGFDGVYLDIIDAFEYFESKSPSAQ